MFVEDMSANCRPRADAKTSESCDGPGLLAHRAAHDEDLVSDEPALHPRRAIPKRIKCGVCATCRAIVCMEMFVGLSGLLREDHAGKNAFSLSQYGYGGAYIYRCIYIYIHI